MPETIFWPDPLDPAYDPNVGSPPTWEDYGRAVVSGAGGVVGAAAGAAEYATGGAVGGPTRRYIERGQESIQRGMTPSAQEAITASALPGAGETSMLEAGLGSSLGLKSAQSLAFLISSIIPGAAVGKVASMLGASRLAAGRAAIAGAQASEGVLAGGDVAGEIYRNIEGLSDDELKRISRTFAGYLSMGMSPADARRALMRDVAGFAPLAAAAITAAVPGVEAAAAGRLAGRTAAGEVLGGARRGAAREATQEAVQSAAQGTATQEALVGAGLAERDWQRILSQTIEGAALGGITGAPVGAAAGIGTRVPKKPAQPSMPVRNAEAETRAPTVPVNSATPPAPPPTNVEVGTPQSAPKRSRRKYPQPEVVATAAVNPTVVVSDPITPAPDEAAAMAQPIPVAPVAPQPAAPTAAPVPLVQPQAQSAQPTAAPPMPGAAPAAQPPVTPQVTQPIPPPSTPAPASVPVQAPRTPRIIPDLSPTAQEARAATAEANRRVRQNVQEMEREAAAPRGKNWTEAQRQERTQANESALKIVGEFPPQEGEANYLGKKGEATVARANILRRARSMVEAAKDQGIAIPKRVQESTDEEMAYNDAVLLLAEAQALVSHSKPGKKEFDRFVGREQAIRSGAADEARAERRMEGEVQRRVGQGAVEEKAAVQTAATEEEAAKAEFAEDAPPEPASVFEGKPDERVVGKDDVETKPKAAAKREVKTFDEEEAAKAAPVRKVEISPEVAAKALAALEAAKNKAAPAEPVKSKVTPKVAEVKAKVEARAKAPSPKQKVAEEAKKVERNPSDAQKAAGNYKQGHIRLAGLGITIQYRKGMERNGVPAPAHYGHILGTEDMDGEQLDVWLGPKAWPGNPQLEKLPVIVIDQVHADTREPDEHKVFLGFDDVAHVEEVYLKSFSDGRGAERVGDLRVMSLEEFKAWKDKRGATKKPAGADVTPVEVSAAADAPAGWDVVETRPESSLSSVVSDEQIGDLRAQSVLDVARTRAVAVQQGTLEQFLKFSQEEVAGFDDFLATDKLQKALFPQMAKRIASAAGNVEVFVVPDKHYKSKSPTAWANYHPVTNIIVMKESVLSDPARFVHTVLHEGAHAAYLKAIWESPAIQATLNDLLATAQSFASSTADPDLIRQYGLLNIDEFVAEAFSNPGFQDFLARIETPKDLKTKLKLDDRVRNMWDTFVDIVRKVLNLPRAHGTLLHGVMRVGSRLELGAAIFEGPASDTVIRRKVHYLRTGELAAELQLPERFQRPDMQEQVGVPKALGLRTMDQLAQLAKDYFGGNNPVRDVFNGIERIRVTAERLMQKSEKMVDRLYQLERRYKGVQWEEFTSLVHDETMAGVFADRSLTENTHLGKDALWGKWAKVQHPELHARWKALPEDLKEARRDAMEFFTAQQNAMSLGIIKNRILKALQISDDDLAQRIHEGTTTDEDKEVLGDAYDVIVEAKELAKIKGPYFPLMRRGTHVVKARYKLRQPAAAGFERQIDDSTFEFNSRDAAVAYAERQETRPSIRSIWVHEQTGEPWVTDTDGTQVRLTKNDTDAVQRWRVIVQNRHVEFFDNAAEARAAASELEKGGLEVEGVEERRFEPGDRQADMLSSQMQVLVRTLENRAGYRGMSALQKNELVQALNEASIRFLGSTRIQSKRLPRRYVEGASKDLTRNTLEYAQSTSGYLGRLEHQPAVDDALKRLREQVASSDYGKERSLGRSAIANEVEKRVAKATAFEELGAFGEVTQRVMTISFLSHLFSPAYSMINALQPTMLTLPTLGARFGAGRSASMLFKAYDDIGGFTVAKQGLAETLRKAKQPDTENASFFEDVKARIKNPQEKAMLQYLADVGSIDPDVGLELARLVEARDGVLGRFDIGLGYLQGMARQMPRAVETINRAVSALAAYRLELSRNGGDHNGAVLYAQEVTNLTQGVYSHTNAPPIFNHPLWRLSLQFKKYGQLIYGLIGHQVGRAIRNAEPGDRAEAVKTLAMIAGTHVVLAGTLGLPTEPIKWLVVAANAAGLTELTWGDVEHAQRQLAADMFGGTVGEMVTRGVTRGLPGGFAFDLSSRVGIADVMTFGEPRSDDTEDLKAYLADLVAGAPGGMTLDWIRGVNQIVSGDLVQGAEKLMPLKVARDSIKAYRTMTEGKKTAAGYEALSPYGTAEGVLRAMGFTPGREAETNEGRSYFYAAQKRETASRNELMHEWIEATPAERARLWGRIEKWNKGRAKGQRLTRAELDSYKKRRQTEKVSSGFRMTRRNKELYQNITDVYNQ